jgi:phosphoserine aminotransferase
MSVFNYSEKYGGTIDSFKYYNDYVIDITDKAEIIKRIKADINKYKKAIIKEVKASGISENLGQKYVRKLRDEYYCSYDTEAITEIMNCITAFDEWCMNFDLSQVN